MRKQKIRKTNLRNYEIYLILQRIGLKSAETARYLDMPATTIYRWSRVDEIEMTSVSERIERQFDGKPKEKVLLEVSAECAISHILKRASLREILDFVTDGAEGDLFETVAEIFTHRDQGKSSANVDNLKPDKVTLKKEINKRIARIQKIKQ